MVTLIILIVIALLIFWEISIDSGSFTIGSLIAVIMFALLMLITTMLSWAAPNIFLNDEGIVDEFKYELIEVDSGYFMNKTCYFKDTGNQYVSISLDQVEKIIYEDIDKPYIIAKNRQYNPSKGFPTYDWNGTITTEYELYLPKGGVE